MQGRMYDGHVLDMIELGIVGYTPMGDIEGSKKLIGSYPCFVFAGDQWDRELTNKKLKNLLLGAWRTDTHTHTHTLLLLLTLLEHCD
ncbi:hypothetical protein EON67_03665 [archaeon]|nr:MAG: hypothetical protein EON67_03665 [archaeon]